MSQEFVPPAYQWYPKDALSSMRIQEMSLEEEGAYRRLLDYQWLNGSIPEDLGQMARLCKGISRTRMLKIWAVIGRCFIQHPDGGFVNIKMETVRSAQQHHRQERSVSGIKGNDIKRRLRMAEARKKGTHSAEEWNLLLELTDRKCVKCGADRPLDKDHVIPVYQEGSDAIDNIQPLCAPCNTGKGPERIDYVPQVVRKTLAERTLSGYGASELRDAKSRSASASASAEEEKKNPPSEGKKTKGASEPPKEFEISDEMWKWTKSEGFTAAIVLSETAKMLDHFRGKGQRRTDWSATWRNWMRNSLKFNGGASPPKPTWAEVEAERQRTFGKEKP